MKILKAILYPIITISLMIPLGLSAQDAGTDSGEEVVELSPFEVSEDSIKGYATTSSLGASRIAVPITELDASVITITEKLIRDTVALEGRDTLNYVSGVNHGNQGTGAQESTTFTIRGYNTSSGQRDGLPDRLFTSSGGFDFSLFERIEIIKGPAGVLYGTHSPGGLLNIVSKKPLAAPRTTLTAIFAQFSTWKLMLDSSGFVDNETKRLGYRINTAFADTDGPYNLANEPGPFFQFNPSISYKFDNGLKVWFWSAIVRDEFKRRAPVIYTFGSSDGSGRPLLRLATDGIYSIVYHNGSGVNTDSFEFGLEHTFEIGGIDAGVRVVGRLIEQQSVGDRVRGIGTRNFINAAGDTIGTNAAFIDVNDVDEPDELVRITRRGIRFDDRGTDRNDDIIAADISLKFKTGGMKHQMLTYFQYQKNDRFSLDDLIDIDRIEWLPEDVRNAFGFTTNPVTGIGQNEVWPQPNVRGITPDWVLGQVAADEADGDTDPDRSADSNRPNADYTQVIIRNRIAIKDEAFSWGMMDRMSMFDNRLFLIGAVRYDDREGDTINITTAGGETTTPQKVSEWTTKFGALYKVFSGDAGEASLFYNRGETFIPVFTTSRKLADFGARFPNRVASTNEVGAKLNLWGSRVVATMSYFDNEETNFLQSFPDLDGSVTGSEDNSFSVPSGTRTTKGFEVDLAVSPKPGLDFLFAYGTVDVALPSGEIPQEIADETLNIMSRYEFQGGPLEGLSFLYQFNHIGESRQAFTRRFDLEFVNPPANLHHVVLGMSRNNWDVRVRIENIFNDVEVIGGNFWTATGVARERNWRVSLTRRF
jgi:outer membrane receptor protein involved in Fe transport